MITLQKTRAETKMVDGFNSSGTPPAAAAAAAAAARRRVSSKHSYLLLATVIGVIFQIWNSIHTLRLSQQRVLLTHPIFASASALFASTDADISLNDEHAMLPLSTPAGVPVNVTATPKGPRAMVCITGQVKRLELDTKMETVIEPLKKAGYEVHIALVVTRGKAEYTNMGARTSLFDDEADVQRYLANRTDLHLLDNPYTKTGQNRFNVTLFDPLEHASAPAIYLYSLTEANRVPKTPKQQLDRTSNHVRIMQSYQTCWDHFEPLLVHTDDQGDAMLDSAVDIPENESRRRRLGESKNKTTSGNTTSTTTTKTSGTTAKGTGGATKAKGIPKAKWGKKARLAKKRKIPPVPKVSDEVYGKLEKERGDVFIRIRDDVGFMETMPVSVVDKVARSKRRVMLSSDCRAHEGVNDRFAIVSASAAYSYFQNVYNVMQRPFDPVEDGGKGGVMNWTGVVNPESFLKEVFIASNITIVQTPELRRINRLRYFPRVKKSRFMVTDLRNAFCPDD